MFNFILGFLILEIKNKDLYYKYLNWTKLNVFMDGGILPENFCIGASGQPESF